ncbi:hypothetical protein EV1_008773 [Malus domestica]
MCSCKLSVNMVLFFFITSLMVMAASAGNFYQDFDIIFGAGRAKILNGGQLLTLNLDQASGSGFKSKNDLEDYAVSPDSIKEAFLKAATTVKSRTTLIFTLDEDEESRPEGDCGQLLVSSFSFQQKITEDEVEIGAEEAAERLRVSHTAGEEADRETAKRNLVGDRRLQLWPAFLEHESKFFE